MSWLLMTLLSPSGVVRSVQCWVETKPGKTTLLSMLLGLLLPTTGRLSVLDCDMLRHRYRVLHRMNFSSPYVDLSQRLTVRENLSVYTRFYSVRQFRQRMVPQAGQLEIERYLDRVYGTLSAGPKNPCCTRQGTAESARCSVAG